MARGFWGLAALRHALPQSNSFDLGLFDQWVWLISRGLALVSSQSADLPLLNDHGAWLLYGLAPLDALLPTVQWLLALQALSLAFTAVPLWILPGCRAAPRAPLDGVRAVVAAAGGVQHQPLRFPPRGAGHAAADSPGDRWSAPVDRGLGRIDPADPRLP